MAGYGQDVVTVQLRPIRADDLAALAIRLQEDDPFGFFGPVTERLGAAVRR